MARTTKNSKVTKKATTKRKVKAVPKRKPGTKSRALDFSAAAPPAPPAPPDVADEAGGAEKLHPIFLRESLYQLFRMHAAMRMQKITVVADEALTAYLAGHGIVVPPRPPRANAKKP